MMAREQPVRVLVVDDQVLMRRGLRKLLETESCVEVVGEAADGDQALERLPGSRPDVVLVDARMPVMNGVELTARLTAHHHDVTAIVLTTFDDDEYIFGALRAGARGYLLKDTPPEELVAAIVKVHRGETVLGGPVAARVVAELRRSPDAPAKPAVSTASEHGNVPTEPLSAREVEVARLVGLGASNSEIAARLFITAGTTKNHLSKILRKLDLRDRTQLALYVTERGWPLGGSGD